MGEDEDEGDDAADATDRGCAGREFDDQAMRSQLFISAIFGMVLTMDAQSVERKLLEQDELVAADLKALGTFGDLGYVHDSSTAYIDTTIVISDTLWMSVLNLGDSPGVCSDILLMTYSPMSHKAVALVEIERDCDRDYSLEEDPFLFYDHRVMSATCVEVLEMTPRRRDENGEPFGALMYTGLRRLTVRPDGSIDDTGVRELDLEEEPVDEPWGAPIR